MERKPFGPALLVGGAGLAAAFLPARSGQQALLIASFVLALLAMALWGRLAAQRALGLGRVGPCTAVYLGQFALFALMLPATALNAVAHRLFGHSLPLIALVVPPTLLLALKVRGKPRLDLLALFALASIALVASIYSRHLSALGLDTHEHTAWMRQILRLGYVPFDESGEGILADYPRAFHLLAALWNAAGLGAPAGAFMKSMPFLQNALPALALAEQMADAQSAPGDAARPLWEVALGLAFFAYAFLLVPMVYPTTDLSGAPRFSSGGLLLLPVVLLIAAKVHAAPGASSAALVALPLLGAWAVTWHPIVAVMLVAASVPMLVAVWAALRPPFQRPPLGALAIASALAILAVARDPWTADLAARHAPPIRALIHAAGLSTYDEAVAAGRASARDKPVHPRPLAPPCADLRCVAGKTAEAFGVALRAPIRAANHVIDDGARLLRERNLAAHKFAFQEVLLPWPALLAQHAALPFCIFLLAPLAALLTSRAARSGLAPRLLGASVAGLTLTGIAAAFAAQLAASLGDGSHESIILSGYLAGAGAFVSLGFFSLPFLAASAILARAPIGALTGWTPPRAARLPALLVWVALPLLAQLNLHRPLQHQGFRGPIGLADLRALRRVEAAIPAEDGVIVPAEHANIAEWEHWLLPTGGTAALLPYGERRYLFNVYLGASYPLSWRDLEERFCSTDPNVRGQFLARTRARWLLVREAGSGDPLRAQEMCGRPLSAIAAQLIHADGGIFLFRLR